MATELAIPFSSTEFEALRLGFLDNNKLHMNACCILPDYETLNEESVMLDFSGALMKTSIKSLEVFDTTIGTRCNFHIFHKNLHLGLSDCDFGIPGTG